MATKQIEILNMITITLLLIVSVLVLTTSTASADNFRIKNCPGTALVDLNWAVRFIDNNLNAILTSSNLNSRYQVRIRERWPKTTLKCHDSSYCSNNPSTTAYQASANKVHICWDNMISIGVDRCELVSIILHEKAHEAHVPHSAQHDERGTYSFEVDIDPVYQFENAVLTYCQAHVTPAIAGMPLGTPGGLAIGDYCDKNAQCLSGQCRWGECVCDDDSDCASGFICKKAGKNRCVRASLPLGAACHKNDQCQSGQCRWGECVCDDDSDCASGFICSKRGKNRCVRDTPPLGAIGATCDKNDQCQSGQCRWGRCVCDDDSDCAPGFICKKTGRNRCIRASMPSGPIGAACDNNDQCQSDQCRWGQCVCDENSDCAPGFICKKTGKNRCVRASLPLGANCDINDQCQSGQCRWGQCVCDENSDCPSGFICKKTGRNRCVRASLPLGANCDKNDQCLSGQCRWGNCVCNDDSDCPSGQRCKTGGKNECIPVGGRIGEVCNRNDDCVTGKCDRDVCVCATDADCVSQFGSNMRCRKGGQNHCQRTNQPHGARCHKDEDCLSDNCKGTGDNRTCR